MFSLPSLILICLNSIQGPGQFHEVYTPVPSITSGGHFYSYDTMHLTGATCDFDKATGGDFTNHFHESPLLTMSMMINNMRTEKRTGKSHDCKLQVA